MDSSTARQLFEALLRQTDRVELTDVRERRDLTVRSVAVNGSRVDVVAGTGDAEWRIVFGSADGRTVDWFSVFARPEPFDGVGGGRGVVVNGPSSSGKSTLLAALAAASPMPWVVFDEPIVGRVASPYLIWRERSSTLHRGFLAAIAALARAGNLVAVAAGGHPFGWFDAAMAGVPTICVGLDCAEDELERRERGRVDVAGGLWAGSPRIHDGWRYDLRFDTAVVTVEEQARQVLAAVGLGDPSGYSHPGCE